MADGRRSTRRSINAEVHLRRSGAVSYLVQAYNLSEHGCKVEFVERPRLLETVWVKFGGIEALRSSVRWTKDFEAGVEFSQPLDSRVLEHLLRQLQ